MQTKRFVFLVCSVLIAAPFLNDVWLIANAYKSLGPINACKLNDVQFKNQGAASHQSSGNFVVFAVPIWCSLNRNTRGGALEAFRTVGSNIDLASNKMLPSTKQVFSLRFGLPSSTFQNSLEAAELKRSWATSMYGDNFSNAELYALNNQNALTALSIVEKRRMASFQILELTSRYGDVQVADQISGYVCISSVKRKTIAESATDQSPFRSNVAVVRLGLSEALEAAEELSTICRLLLVEGWNPVSALLPSYIADNWDLNSLRQPENVNEAPVGQTFAERVIIANDAFIIKMALHFKSSTMKTVT